MAVFEALYCPAWFCSIDSLIDIASVFVVLLLAWSAWSYSRMDTSGKRYRAIAFAFGFLALAFIAKVGFDLLLHHELLEAQSLVVRYDFRPELSDYLMVASLYLYKFLLLGGLYLLFSVLDNPSRPHTVLVFSLFALAIYFTEGSYFVFHAIVALLAVLITIAYVKRAHENHNKTTRLLAATFGVFCASSLLFIFARVDMSLYLLAKALQFIAFSVLLYIFIVLHKHAKLHGKKTLTT